VPGTNCDDCSVAVALPFSFPFYDGVFNSVNVSSNGNIQFGSSNTTFTNSCLPTAIFNGAALPYWDDLYMVPAGQGVYTSTSGIAPDRVFNIEWRASYFPGAGSANFEVRLHETSGQIEFIYGVISNGIISATGGLQQGTGTAIESIFCNGTGQPVPDGQGVSFACLSTPTTSVLEIPAASGWGLAALALILSSAALFALRRRT
jgi:hypothetical protein